MAITETDFSGNTFTLSPMIMTDTQQTLVTNIISNIQGNKTLMDTLGTESQTKMNEVIGAINALQDGTTVDIDALQAQIDAILFLESEAGNDSFVGAFTKLYDAINSRKETLAFNLPVTASPDGLVALDLTSYGFTALTDFEVIPQMVTTTGKNIDVTFEKVDVTSGTLTLRDGDRLSFSGNAESYYEAETKGSVEVTVIIVKTATPIVADLTEVDGDEVHLGHDASDHDPVVVLPDYTVQVIANNERKFNISNEPALVGAVDDTLTTLRAFDRFDVDMPIISVAGEIIVPNYINYDLIFVASDSSEIYFSYSNSLWNVN